MKKVIIMVLISVFSFVGKAKADEGMWQLNRIDAKTAQAM